MRDVLPFFGIAFFVAGLLGISFRSELLSWVQSRRTREFYPYALLPGATQKSLFRLTQEEPVFQKDPMAEAMALELRDLALRRVEETPSYCAFFYETLGPGDPVGISFRADIQSSHRFHVLQFMPEKGWLDEWITFDGTSYSNAGLWVESAEETERYYNQLRRFAKQTYLRVLGENEPQSVRLGRIRRSAIAEFRFSGPFGVEPLDTNLDQTDLTDGETDELSLIIDVDTGHLLKATRWTTFHISRYRDAPDGWPDFVPLSVHAAYLCHGDDIAVAPPDWLNATPNEEGRTVITDLRVVPPIPFHDNGRVWP